MPHRGANIWKGTQFVGTGSTSFDGTNDYIDTGATFKTTFDGSFTISAWIKPTDGNPSSDEVFIGTNNADDTDAMWFYVRDGGELGFWYEANNNSDLTLTSSDMFTDGQQDWCHVCAVVDDSLNQVSLYFNGVLQTLSGSYDGDISAITNSDFQSSGTTPNLFIGALSDNGTSASEFNGSMKNVAIWNRALTATEVQNVMYKTYPEVSGRLASGLVSWWGLDVDSLGSEIATGSWSVNGTWSEDGGVLTGSGETDTAGMNSILTLGKTYQVSFSTSVTSGTFQPFTGSGGAGTIVDSSGDYAQIITCATSTHLFFDGVSSFTGTISNVSVKEIQVEDLKGSNDGTVYGATIDEDLYGGDTPVIPRAIDNAPTVQADAIGAGSAVFDGTDDYITIADDSTLDIAGDWSISTWIKIDSGMSSYHRVIGKQDPSSNQCNYGIGIATTNKIGAIFNDGSWRTAYSADALVVGQWYHIVGVWDDSEENLHTYIDGSLIATTNVSGGSPSGNDDPLLIGLNEIGDTEWFDGNICQVGIWDAALTQAQIQSIMEKTYEELTASEKEDLVSYWALDVDGSDSHGDNDGTLT